MPGTNQTKNELERQARVSDMMVSMHSELRDGFGRRALALYSLLSLSSIILIAFVFTDPSLLRWASWGSTVSRVTVGALAIATFFFSLIAARVDWKGKSEAHAAAARAYVELKLEIGELLPRFDEASTNEVTRMAYRYSEIGRSHIPVPESRFLDLKGKHRTKVLLSRYLDRYPGASIRVARLKLWLRHTFQRSEL